MADSKNYYDKEKMEDLKKKIEEKLEELNKEINKALGSNDRETYNHLKQLQLQCTAELRLIKHIEDGFKEVFLIC